MDSTTITTISSTNITSITRTYYYYITGAYIIMISLVGPANLDIVYLILPYTTLPTLLHIHGFVSDAVSGQEVSQTYLISPLPKYQ